MHVQVRQQAEVEPGPPRQQVTGEIQRHPVGVRAQQARETDVALGDERQRGQEVLAELAIGHPRRAVLERLERQRVDEDRPAGPELDVVGGGVLELPADGHRVELRIERQERRVAKLAECPLVRVTDELDELGPDDRVGVGALGELDRHRVVRDEPILGQEARLERAGLEGVPLGREALLDLPVRPAALPEDEATGVAERPGVALDGPGFRGGRRRRDGRVSDPWRRHPRGRGSRPVCFDGGRRRRSGRSGAGRTAAPRWRSR